MNTRNISLGVKAACA